MSRHRRDSHFSGLEAMLDVLDAHDGAALAVRRITLPSGDPPARPVELQPPLPSQWPAFGEGGKPMSPLPGWSLADMPVSGTPVLAVALFGLDIPAIRQSLNEIARQQRETQAFLPIFFTDCPEHGLFRRKGYLVEYFSPEICADAPENSGFRDRFALLWRKWGAGALIDLSAAGYLAPRIRGFAQAELKPGRDNSDRRWERAVPDQPPLPSPDIAALRGEYAVRRLDQEPDTFVLYRIIGNDLHPRHERGQSLRSVRFILDHEPPLAGCEKRWIVNRIFDRQDEAAILQMLDDAGQPYLHIPFEWDAYAGADWDFSGFEDPAFHVSEDYGSLSPRLRLRVEARLRRHKINYLVNNNGARNAALEDGRGRAKWILPWDGNCFLSKGAWEEITSAVTAKPYLKYFHVPMARLVDNASLFAADFRPEAAEEPQILFRRDAEETFDESFPYGRRPKVELLWRLGVPGTWDQSRDDVWDLPRRQRNPRGAEFGGAGWVARLSSGMSELEAATKIGQSGREIARNEAIVATLDELDAARIARAREDVRLTSYDLAALEMLARAPSWSLAASWRDALQEAATAALARGPYSVVDKTTMPPSADTRDYWHPAPYWWPNPATPDGLPYVRRDGERVPGSELYGPLSHRYDRTRLQYLFDDTTVLALAWKVTGKAAFAAHGARLVCHWFLAPDTRMNPHMRFAQWRPDQESATIRGFGLIEMKDMYFFLDAVRLLRSSEALSAADEAGFRDWLRQYLDWVRSSPQGLAERSSRNNHGTCYDLQMGAIAAFLGEDLLLAEVFKSAKARILQQFASDGSQPEELARTQTAHYTAFNLQSWVNLGRLARSFGIDLWSVAGPQGQSLVTGLTWLLPLLDASDWPYEQSEPFDRQRRLPLVVAAIDNHVAEAATRDEARNGPGWKALYFPHDGIKPFWLIDHLSGCAEFAIRQPRR